MNMPADPEADHEAAFTAWQWHHWFLSDHRPDTPLW
jgi:hypothetical protein